MRKNRKVIELLSIPSGELCCSTTPLRTRPNFGCVLKIGEPGTMRLEELICKGNK